MDTPSISLRRTNGPSQLSGSWSATEASSLPSSRPPTFAGWWSAGSYSADSPTSSDGSGWCWSACTHSVSSASASILSRTCSSSSVCGSSRGYSFRWIYGCWMLIGPIRQNCKLIGWFLVGIDNTVGHKVHTYQEYHSVCPLVGIGTLPPPISPASVPLPPESKGGGAHSRAGEGLGESQVQRLEKKLSTLPTLCCGARGRAWFIKLVYIRRITAQPLAENIYVGDRKFFPAFCPSRTLVNELLKFYKILFSRQRIPWQCVLHFRGYFLRISIRLFYCYLFYYFPSCYCTFISFFTLFLLIWRLPQCIVSLEIFEKKVLQLPIFTVCVSSVGRVYSAWPTVWWWSFIRPPGEPWPAVWWRPFGREVGFSRNTIQTFTKHKQHDLIPDCFTKYIPLS